DSHILWTHTIVLSHRTNIILISHFANREMRKITYFLLYLFMPLNIIHLKTTARFDLDYPKKQLFEQKY
ncbi:MAG: hypothetical protein V4549_08190, partial [Bacteroidota bacterium]